jgi:hypothetical protein
MLCHQSADADEQRQVQIIGATKSTSPSCISSLGPGAPPHVERGPRPGAAPRPSLALDDVIEAEVMSDGPPSCAVCGREFPAELPPGWGVDAYPALCRDCRETPAPDSPHPSHAYARDPGVVAGADAGIHRCPGRGVRAKTSCQVRGQ